MSWNHRLALLFTLVMLAALTGCGGGNQLTAPMNNGFTNASLNGAFAFSVTGTDMGGAFSAAIGSFQANGKGSITSGTVDVNSQGTTGISQAIPITGTYTVQQDGRVLAQLSSSQQNGIAIALNFVLTSTQHGLVVRSDTFAIATGSIDMQATQASVPSGPFAFSFSGANGNTSFDTAGAFTVGNTGAVSGVQDINNNGTASTNLALSGSMSGLGAGGRGTASFTATGGGTLSLVFYVVDATHIKFMEIDNNPVVAGDAFQQPALTVANSSFAFTMGGSSSNTPFVLGAVFTTDGNGNITSSTEDLNSGGNVTMGATFASGTLSVAANGRGTLTVNSTAGGPSQFVVYPATTGSTDGNLTRLLVLETDFNGVSSGSAFVQQAGPFSNGSIQGTYGFLFSGAFSNGTSVLPIDSSAQVSANGGSLTGALDLNNAGQITTGLALSGQYSIGANGRGTGTLNTSATRGLNAIYYVVSPTRILFIENDPIAQVFVGSLVQQTP